MLVPSANNIFVDLSVVAKVTPVPETVLNSTVKTPTVPFSIIYVFSVTIWNSYNNISSNSSC
jgi:hypothetical protein